MALPFRAPFVIRRKYTSVVLSNVSLDVSASAACVRTNSILQGLARLPPPKETHTKTKTKTKTESEADFGADSTQHRSNNRVYFATSADLTKQTFVDKKDSRLREKEENTIRMIRFPPNRSDIAEEHFWKGTKNSKHNQEQEQEQDHEHSDGCASGIANVDLVLFDRFYVEEAHSFRFRRAFPEAALVLDMQDMHSLRWGRQAIVESWDKEQKQKQKQQKHFDASNWDPLRCLPRVMEYLPTVPPLMPETETRTRTRTRESDRFLRELASIHRSDLVLVCSPKELHWLESVYNVPKEKLVLASFFVETRDRGNRNNPPLPPTTRDATIVVPPRFVFCGGFKHAPNLDAVRLLIDCVWPRLQSELPNATLHIYGAFCPDELFAEANTKKNHKQKHHRERIFVHGYEPDLSEIFGQDGGILLAPLRFGAGIKGKIVDAWTFGMPVVTTPIGSEGMTMTVPCKGSETHGDGTYEIFGGAIASDLDSFCKEAIDLATNTESYNRAQSSGKMLLEELFSASRNWEHVRERLLEVMDTDFLSRNRQKDFTQAMLWHQSMRSTEYFSRWVELKETSIREKNESPSREEES